MQNLISHFLLKNTVCLRISASEMYQLFLHSSLFISDWQKEEKPGLSVLCGEISALAQHYIRNGGQRQDDEYHRCTDEH
ncbi:MAG: hypothetical protein IIY93_00395, partial [Clostridia bacterium]|nr:hypothetical protein [Clostridia bacterium]